MQAQPKTIRDILHTGDQYIIPLFQRFYSWEKVHWEKLRMDIWELMEDGSKPIHFLGPLVCTLPPRLPGNSSAFQLIDGQQRITTLTILLSAIRDVARSRGLNDFAEEVTEDYLLFKRKQGSDRYKVLPRLGDREVLTAMIEGHDMSSFTDSRVFESWKYFHRHVQHLSRRDTEAQLRKLLDAIATRLNLVAVLIDGENPYEIFGSLNSTGLPLKESDLIRNFVFMAIPLAKQPVFNDQHWKAFEQMFGSTDAEEAVEMTPFYRDYLMRNGRYSKEDATFVDFKNTHEEAVQMPESLVVELVGYARLDLMLRRPGTVKDEILRRMLRQIEGMEITTAYPLLLNLLDRHDRGELGKEDLCGCLSDLISFVLRRSICGESTRAYGKWFVEATTMIRGNPRVDLQSYWLDRRWPDDAAVRERLPNFELYRRESTKARVMLEALEESFGHRERVDLTALTIEHVMPQTITNNKNGRAWKQMLGEEWERTHDALLHTLGNLTLTGYNNELSNSAFETKQVELAKSHLDLNTYFPGLRKWYAGTIRERSVALTERVLVLWPRPASSVVYTASAEAMPEPDGLTNAAKAKLEYWRHLDSRLEERGVPHELIAPAPDSSVSISLGEAGEAEFVLSFNQTRGQIHVSLSLSGNVGGRIAKGLAQHKNAIHQDLGYELKWELSNSGGEIYVTDEGIPIRDQNDWPVQHDWFGDRLEDFQRVLRPRVLASEREAMQDPEIRQALAQRELQKKYWRACAAALAGASVSLRESDTASGRTFCRFAPLDDGISFGSQYYPSDASICVYLGVTSSAGRNQRRLFKELIESQIPEVERTIGQKVNIEDPYVWVAISGDIRVQADWPRQHQWIRESAEKFVGVFKPRLAID
jgi:uncharacterized protein with ParB-like and HNH nuclease domain